MLFPGGDTICESASPFAGNSAADQHRVRKRADHRIRETSASVTPDIIEDIAADFRLGVVHQPKAEVGR